MYKDTREGWQHTISYEVYLLISGFGNPSVAVCQLTTPL